MRILVIGATGFIGKYYKKYTKNKKVFFTSTKKRKDYIKFDLRKDKIEKILIKKKLLKSSFYQQFPILLNVSHLKKKVI